MLTSSFYDKFFEGCGQQDCNDLRHLWLSFNSFKTKWSKFHKDSSSTSVFLPFRSIQITYLSFFPFKWKLFLFSFCSIEAETFMQLLVFKYHKRWDFIMKLCNVLTKGPKLEVLWIRSTSRMGTMNTKITELLNLWFTNGTRGSNELKNGGLVSAFLISVQIY